MKGHYFTRKLLITTCALFLVARAEGQVAARAEAEIEAIMAKYQAIGTAVTVVKGRDIIYSHSFGLKNVETGAALDNDDIFRIASISKSFVTTGIMQLVEAGKLSLNDDVSDLIGFRVRNPNFPDSVITLRLIL